MTNIIPLLVVIVFFFQYHVFALPKFSLKEKKRCYHCHFDKNGGGPLNERGKFYSQHKSFENYREGVAKFSEKEKVAVVKKKSKEKERPTITEKEKISTEATLFDRTTLGADIALSFLVNEERGGPQNFFLMKAEPLVTTQVTENFLTVFGYNLATPVLTAYGQYNKDPFYVQVGSFHIPFGLAFLDYNNVVATLIKEQYDLSLDTRDIGLEFGARQDFYGRIAIVNGSREPRERPTLRPTFDRDLGYVFDAGYQGIFYEVPFLLGASFLLERRLPPGEPVRGRPSNPVVGERVITHIVDMYGQLGYKDFSLLGEFMFGRNTPVNADDSFGFYVKASYNVYPYWTLSARGEMFANDRKFLSDSRLRFVAATEYQFSKYISLEPMYRINVELGDIPQTRNNDFIALLSMKF